jgi:hypothetical protein
LTVKTAAVDQDKLRSIIGDAVKEAEASDPKILRRQLAAEKQEAEKLRRELAKMADGKIAAPAPAELRQLQRELASHKSLLEDAMKFIVTVNAQKFSTEGVIDEAALQAAVSGAVQKVAKEVKAKVDAQIDEYNRLKKTASRLQEQIETLLNSKVSINVTVEKQEPYKVVAPPRQSRPVNGTPQGDTSIGKVHRAFLTVLANRQGKTTTRNQLAVFSGYSATSRHVDNTISACRTAGWLEGESSRLVITDAGLSALGSFDELPTGEALRNYWIRETGAAPGAMLKALCEVYPKSLSRDEVAEVAGYSVTSRHVDNSLSYLRTLELISGSREALTASEELF